MANIYALLSLVIAQIEWGSIAQWVGALGSIAVLVWTVTLVCFGKPNLTIRPSPDLQRQDPPVTNPSSMWIRFRVTNSGIWRKTARNCRAFLTGLYKAQGANTFAPMSPAEYNDILQLTWTHGPREPTGMDILPGAQQRFDLLATAGPAEGGFLQLQTWPVLPAMTIVQPGSYLAIVQVSAEDTEAKTMPFLILWNGHWDQVRAEAFTGRYELVDRG